MATACLPTWRAAVCALKGLQKTYKTEYQKACVSGVEINGVHMANNLTTSTIITKWIIKSLNTHQCDNFTDLRMYEG